MKNAFLVFAVIILLSVLSSCYIVTKGVFDGSEAVEWKHTVENGGVSVYTLGAPRSLQGRVSFATESDGSVYVNAGYPEQRSSDVVQIIFSESGTIRTLAFQQPMTLDVKGSHEFTVVFPSFTIAGISHLGLKARFKWSDRNVRYYQQLQ